MKAIVATDQAAGTAGVNLKELPKPEPAGNDVLVEIEASGFILDEVSWPGTWADRTGRARENPILGHEFAGTIVELGYGTAGLSIGQRVFGLTDWTRDGTLAEFSAVEARNVTPLPDDIDAVTGAAVPISTLTAWQGLFVHGRLQAGQSILVHGAAGAVGTAVTQLAREAGAHVIGTGRASGRATALEFGAAEYVDLDVDDLSDVGAVDFVFDPLLGDVNKRSAPLVRPGGSYISISGPVEHQPAGALTVDFVVEADRAQLAEIAQRVRDGRLRSHVGTVVRLADAVAAFNPTQRTPGKTVIRMK